MDTSLEMKQPKPQVEDVKGTVVSSTLIEDSTRDDLIEWQMKKHSSLSSLLNYLLLLVIKYTLYRSTKHLLQKLG